MFFRALGTPPPFLVPPARPHNPPLVSRTTPPLNGCSCWALFGGAPAAAAPPAAAPPAAAAAAPPTAPPEKHGTRAVRHAEIPRDESGIMNLVHNWENRAVVPAGKISKMNNRSCT